MLISRGGVRRVRRLLLDGRRKSVEPMAARLDEDGHRQDPAQFITSSPWGPAHVRARLAWRMQDAIGTEALIVDDTGRTRSHSAVGYRPPCEVHADDEKVRIAA
ncbi:transposase [Streptomyces sp. NPDC000983]|uniref:transposase n=1 Tax=Streptomyces sp. NPDC000983 TaxID=3154373 RepID=UPI0033278A3C